MRFVLDTNTWIWLFSEPQRIRREVLAILELENAVGLSPISVVEVAQKSAKGRLTFSVPLDEWVRMALPKGRIHLIELSPEIALRAYLWPDFHGDPADRIIAATAVIHGYTLVTSDGKLLSRADLDTLSTL